MNIKTTHKAGGNIDSWCLKCKLLLAHTIEALVGTSVKKCQCNTCGAKHAYRPYGPGLKPKKLTSTRMPSLARALKASDYDQVFRNRDTSSPKLYSLKSSYTKGEVIKHNFFGIGCVMSSKGPKKIEVLFPEGAKVLIHNPAEPTTKLS